VELGRLTLTSRWHRCGCQPCEARCSLHTSHTVCCLQRRWRFRPARGIASCHLGMPPAESTITQVQEHRYGGNYRNRSSFRSVTLAPEPRQPSHVGTLHVCESGSLRSEITEQNDERIGLAESGFLFYISARARVYTTHLLVCDLSRFVVHPGSGCPRRSR